MEISLEHLRSGFHRLCFESQLVPITDTSVKLRKIISNGVHFPTDKKSDRIKDIYEGGAKIWECTFDLIDYLYQHRDALNLAASYSHQSKSGLKFLELGCGSALVSCYLSLILADRPYTMYLQDYNPFVIEQISFPNVIVNLENYEKTS